MKIVLGTSAMLLALSSATAWGQQPAVYPLRSQSAAAQGIDSAYCYWHAKQQTGVDMTRLSQRPPRTKEVRFAPDAGKGASEPPLPPRAGAAASAVGAKPGAAAAASSGGPAAHGASSSFATAQPSAPGSSAANVASASSTSAGAAASGAQPGAAAASGASAPGATPASATASASGAASPLPPLPPPEPPMATYWHAYGDCMQVRGYGVQ